MHRRRAVADGRPAELSAAMWRWLCDAGPMPVDVYFLDEADLWRRHRAAVLAAWIAQHPGTRPSAWWRHEAPEPRQQIGGTGRPIWEAMPTIAPWYRCGVPVQMVDIAADDPPLYEAERDYLARLGLLTEDES